MMRAFRWHSGSLQLHLDRTSLAQRSLENLGLQFRSAKAPRSPHGIDLIAI